MKVDSMNEGEAVTLLDALERNATRTPDKLAYLFCADTGAGDVRLTWGELHTRVQSVARHVAGRFEPGSRVLLSYPPGLEFVVSFLACLAGRVVAVPVYPPSRGRAGAFVAAVAADCGARGVLTHATLHDTLAELVSTAGAALELLDTGPVENEGATRGAPPAASEWRPHPADVAFIQYTSGSTRTPKGVCVTHQNLMANQRAIASAFTHDSSSVVVGWLPVYHDMGLIGNVLQPLYLGAECILMSPLEFLRSPQAWLERIAKYRATTSGGPNFAYELCCRRVPESVDQRLDLSSWRLAYNGSEPVRADTMRRFVQRFGKCGFRAEAFYPCYGLAEATLFVSGGRAGRPPEQARVDAERLERGEAVVAAEGKTLELTSCGTAREGHSVCIVENARELSPGRVGEIWVAGPSVAAAYWGDPAATDATFGAALEGRRDRYLRTGDLGFELGGELYVTGRIKDLIILRGRNLYAHDIEWLVESASPLVRAGCCAAFALDGELGEELALVCEVAVDDSAALQAATRDIRAAVAHGLDVNPALIALVRPRSLPKTSSGKLRRALCKKLLGERSFTEVYRWERSLGDELEASPREALPALDEAGIEAALRSAWQELLGVADVRPADDFFRLGGDSLLAMRVVARLEQELGVRVPLERFVGNTAFSQMRDLIVDQWRSARSTTRGGERRGAEC